MGFTLNPDIPAKNRVGDFFWKTYQYAPDNNCAALYVRRENTPTATKPASGRTLWLSRDPIAEDGGINLYAYVNNDPINWLDFDGLAGSRASDAQRQRNQRSVEQMPEKASSLGLKALDLLKQALEDILGEQAPSGLGGGIGKGVGRCMGPAMDALTSEHAPEAMKAVPDIIKRSQMQEELINSVFGDGTSSTGNEVGETLERHQGR